MEVIGEFNPKSTPETRKRDRDRARMLGDIWTIVTTNQPFLIVLVILGFVAAGFVENVYIP